MNHARKLVVALTVAAAVGIGAERPAGRRSRAEPPGRRRWSGDQGVGRGGQGGGRGAQNCPTPTIPAAEACISSQLGPANWPNPPLPDGPIMIQSALNQHRDLRVSLLKGLNQPWSMAWLPDGTMLVTERGGRLRVVRNWVLNPTPVAGVPQVQAGGLQGLMDVVVHPRFAENRFVYLRTTSRCRGSAPMASP